MDKWGAYPAALNRFLKFLRERKPSNPVVITGDIHSNWVATSRPISMIPGSAVVATEFVGTSITSGGDGMDMRPDVERQMGENPHVKFFNGQRGYVRCDVNPKRWQTDFRILAAVTKTGRTDQHARFVRGRERQAGNSERLNQRITTLLLIRLYS